jgi:hypothetical protein
MTDLLKIYKHFGFAGVEVLSFKSLSLVTVSAPTCIMSGLKK